MDTPVFHPHVTGFPVLPSQGIERHFKEHGYRVVINVSDDPMWANAQWYRENGIEYYWFPMGDCGPMGLQPIYGAIIAIHEAERRGLQVLVHCAAGINRSQCVMDCYWFMSRGHYRTWQPPREVKVNWLPAGDNTEIQWRTMLERACSNPANKLPTLRWMERWLTALYIELTGPIGVQAGTFDLAYLMADKENK